MKAQNIMKSLVIAIIVLAGFSHAWAVEYLNSYQPSAISRPHSAVSRQAVLPSAGFQSTSAYAAPEWAGVSMLNADGTVNEGAYMGGRNNAPASGPRRDPSAPNPEVDEGNDDGNTPLGDALIPLALLACAYAVYKLSRRRKTA